MDVVIEVFRAAHFLGMLFFFLAFSLWIREEFITIFNRKKVAGFSILKVLLIRVISENNGLYLQQGRSKFFNLSMYILTLMGAILPFFFIQMSDRFDLGSSEIYFGLIGTNNSWLFFFGILILSELSRYLYDPSYLKVYAKIPLLIALLLTFVMYSPSFSVEQMVQYQKSFSELGLRNYFLLKNPIGVILMSMLFYVEVDNPKNDFTLINHLFLNTYIILFVYGFLGGYGLPSILERQNITPGWETVLLQNLSLMAKFIFSIIMIWVFKYSLIKTQKVIRLND